LKKKNLDFIVLNSLRDKNAGFQSDTNKISIISANGKKTDFPMKSKKEVAEDIVNFLCDVYGHEELDAPSFNKYVG
jgi:phosphopantothenoylcysteine decarboxylase/phosphopantothenate--cysteine ligase